MICAFRVGMKDKKYSSKYYVKTMKKPKPLHVEFGVIKKALHVGGLNDLVNTEVYIICFSSIFLPLVATYL